MSAIRVKDIIWGANGNALCACFRQGHRGAVLAPVQLELWDALADEWKLVEM